MQRKHLRLLGASFIGLAVVATACGSSKKSSSGGTGGGSGVSCKAFSLGFFGALTGDSANLGINIKRGVDLAADQWNTANPNCKVSIVSYDSQGDPKQAPALAQKAVNDKAVLGIIGPAFSGESKAANPIFNQAVLPIITPSATNPTLSQQGWTIFHRMLATDAKQGPDAANYIKSKLNATKVFVIDDASEYGKGLADEVRSTLGSLAIGSDSIDPSKTDYSATVSKVKAASPDVVFFGGYYSQAGTLAKQLQDGGVTAKFMSGDGTLDVGFIQAAGPAGEGAFVSCPCNLNGNDTFLNAYKAKFNDTPRTYASEAYDATNTFLAAVKAGKTNRKDINSFLSSYQAVGVSRQIKWDQKGEIGEGPTYIFQVKSGAFLKVDAVA
jgi:branched-chain amino acid transport system substrate-binding protein